LIVPGEALRSLFHGFDSPPIPKPGTDTPALPSRLSEPGFITPRSGAARSVVGVYAGGGDAGDGSTMPGVEDWRLGGSLGGSEGFGLGAAPVTGDLVSSSFARWMGGGGRWLVERPVVSAL